MDCSLQHSISILIETPGQCIIVRTIKQKRFYLFVASSVLNMYFYLVASFICFAATDIYSIQLKRKGKMLVNKEEPIFKNTNKVI